MAGDPFQLFAALATPAVIVDAQGRVVYLNASAEAFWGTSLRAAAGRSFPEALRLRPAREEGVRAWLGEMVERARGTAEAFSCDWLDAEGSRRRVRLCATRFLHGDAWHLVLTAALAEPLCDPLPEAPEWALTDPLTGLHNRHQWEREFPHRNARGGAVIFFDLDGLKEINDLYGHRTGDEALAITARTLRGEAPPDALLVRFGGDEFVLVLTPSQSGTAAAMAVGKRVVALAALAAVEAGLPLPLHLSFGVAGFSPGDLQGAVQRADDEMYEYKGVLLRGASGGRIVLTRAGRALVSRPGDGRGEQRPGMFASRFGPDFDGYFRQVVPAAVEQARAFVALVAPESGQAAVEVGAGSGRITLDGGLAERIGPSGQLLVTDPALAQIRLARQRAHEAGLSWLRFVQAPVEDLPVATGTADLAIGAGFLHFTDPQVALRAMARVVRPGGRVAIQAFVDPRPGPAWAEALAPVLAEAQRWGIPCHPALASREELAVALRAAGLALQRWEEHPPTLLAAPSAEVLLALLRQSQFLRLLLRAASEGQFAQLEQRLADRVRTAFSSGDPAWTSQVGLVSILTERVGQSRGEGGRGD